MDVIPPHVNAVPTDEDGIRIRVLVHGLLEKLGQVLLVGGVLDNGDAEGVVVPQIALLAVPLPESLDLLDVVDLEELGVAAGRCRRLEDEGDEHGPVRVGVDAAAGAALGKGGEEERRALRRLVEGRRAQVGAVLEGGFLGGEGEDVDVGRLHELFLHA